MSVTDEYIRFVCDLLESCAPLRIKRMFGGAGGYSGDLIFAILADDTLYLKVDERTRGAYEALGLHPFTYSTKKGRAAAMAYYPVPLDVLEDPDALAAWARDALEAARRAAAKRVGPS